MEVDSSEQLTKTVSAAEDILQGKIDTSVACQSDALFTDEIAGQSDASLVDSKAPHDASAQHSPGSTKEDDYVLHSEVTGVDVTGSKQDDMKVDDTQVDDTSRDSSSHLASTSLSTQSDQPPDQGEIAEDRKEQVKMEETLGKSSGDNQTSSENHETSHDTASLRNSPSEYLNKHCSAQVDGDTFENKENIVEIHAAMNIYGPGKALDASSMQSQKEGSTTDVGLSTGGDTSETKETTVETHAAMNADGPEEAQDALSTKSDKEASMAEVGVPTDSSPTACNAHNDLEGQVSCEETLVRADADNRTHISTNDDSNNKDEDTMVNSVDSKQEPMEESTIISSEISDLNKQSCSLHFQNDPPSSTHATVEPNKGTGDAEMVCPGRLESSVIETGTVGVQETIIGDLERSEKTGVLDEKTGSPQGDDVLGASCSMLGGVCEKTPIEDLTAGSHLEAPVEPTQETTVANAVVFMDACNTEPHCDSTAAEGQKQTVEMVHPPEKQSAAPEHVKTQAKPTVVCGPMLLDESQTAGLEDNFSVLKHGSPASSELVVESNPTSEVSAIQVETEATKSDGYCTAEDGNGSLETVMELEPNKETTIPMLEDTTETNDTITTYKVSNDSHSHANGEAVMEMQSSEIKAASSIQSGAGNISTHTPAMSDGTEQTNMASTSEVSPENDKAHMPGTSITCM